jgi:hypothetical protein
MIWLEHDTPLIKLGDAGAVALEHGWLQQCLEEAARAAGYQEWPAYDVARSVTAFLISQHTGSPYSLEGFTSAVHRALQGIGYTEVAPHFLREGIELRISLLDLAREAGEGFELGFFKACDKACARLLASGIASRVCFEDLHPAVKTALAKAHWSARCEAFTADIVDFLRNRLLHRTGARPIAFLIR